MRSRRRPILVLAAASLAALAAVTIAVWPAASAGGNPGTGDVLGRAPATGSLRLLAFLATQPDTASPASRAQAVELVSLATQYGTRGLGTQIVDESGAGRDALVNTYYDWQLGDVRVTADPSHSTAQRYDATGVPTVLLLDASGTVVQRWDSGVRTVQAEQIIAAKLPG